MLVLPFSDLQTSLGATPPFDSSSVKQQVDQFGVGAKVKLKLAGGKMLRGSIQAIEDESLFMTTGGASTPQRIAFDQIAQVKLAKITYKASGQPDYLEVRRVVTALGVGKHIMVRTTRGNEYHGNIQAIDQEHFIMLPDLQSVPVQIGYGEVAAMGPNLSMASKIAILIVVAVVVTVAIIAIQNRNKIGGF
jgi:small nuclear ribonucleoprotein (snRNP)-like protein